MSNVLPRRRVYNTYAGKEFYHRIVWDESAKGGLLCDAGLERRGTLLLYGYARHYSGRLGTSFPSMRKLREDMGYTGNGHDLVAQRQIAYDLGFLTRVASRGRDTHEVALSVPVVLIDKYKGANGKGADGKDHEDITEHLSAEIIGVWDMTATPPEPETGHVYHNPDDPWS